MLCHRRSLVMITGVRRKGRDGGKNKTEMCKVGGKARPDVKASSGPRQIHCADQKDRWEGVQRGYEHQKSTELGIRRYIEGKSPTMT